MPAQSGTPVQRSARGHSGRGWVVAAAVVALVTSLALLTLPTVSTATSTGGTGQTGRESLFVNQGWTIAVTLAVPVLISAVPLLVPTRHRRWATLGAAALLTAGAMLGAASIGLFYLPAVVLLWVAAVRMLAAADAQEGQ